MSGFTIGRFCWRRCRERVRPETVALGVRVAWWG
ncbi:MAG: hypothetical protein RL077_2144 [Verrucomicrobiota bacterium]|jgi:hypothetical protein